MLKEAELHGFLGGKKISTQAMLRTGTGRVAVNIEAGDGQVSMFAVPAAVRPEDSAGVVQHFETMVATQQWEDHEFHLEFPSYRPAHATASWLRAAYLAFFARLGYRFIMRPELDVVRARLKNPALSEPVSVRLVRPEAADPTLIRINEPTEFRSYAMLLHNQVIFLPRFGDARLYERLQAQDGPVQFRAINFGWPRYPTLMYDLVAAKPRQASPGGGDARISPTASDECKAE